MKNIEKGWGKGAQYTTFKLKNKTADVEIHQ